MNPEIEELLSSPPFVPLGVAASLLGISYNRVWELVREGRMATKTVCGARFVFVSSIALHASRRRTKRPV
jgi:hypothetical protein